ncbi:hypothetical protein PRNP1_012974 [Phytophthora ramorum]
MESKPEQDDYYLRETLLEHGRSTDHNGIVVDSWKTEFFDCFDDCVPNGAITLSSSSSVAFTAFTNCASLWCAPCGRVHGNCIPRGVDGANQANVSDSRRTRWSSPCTWASLYLLAHLSASLEYPFFIFVCVAAGMASVMWVAIPIGVILLRVHIRELFSIPGNIAEDVVVAFVCGPCTIA